MVSEVLGRLDIDLWENSADHQKSLLKLNMIDFVCRMQSEVCLNKASSLFQRIPSDYFSSTGELEGVNP